MTPDDPQQHLQILLDTTSDWIWEIDRQGIIRYTNPRCQDLLGYSPEELLGTEIFARLLPDQQDHFRQHFASFVQNKQGFDKELNPNVHKDGRLVILESSARPFFDAQGELLGFRGTDRDVTERQQHQHMLEEQRRQLESIMNNCPGAIYRCMADDDFTLTFLSQGGMGVFGLAEDAQALDEIGNFKHLIHPDDFAMVDGITRKALEQQSRFTIEYRIRDCNGEEKWVWERGSGIYDRSHNAIGLEGIILDISAQRKGEKERKAIEQRMQQSQHLESLGILAGGIAHDFNNILMAIMGHAELAKMRYADAGKCLSSLNEVIHATVRASDLCRQMLAYTGKTSFEQCPVSIAEVIRDMIRLLSTNISKKATLHTALDPAPPPVMADPSQLRQVVMNLLLNASDSLQGNPGDIHISCLSQQCDAAFLALQAPEHALEPGTFTVLQVRDSGCGMDAVTKRNLFSPFFSTKENGRGLGLAAVHGIINAYQGFITVASEEGEGSTFTCYFPTAPLAQTESLINGSDTNWQGQGCVLLVDDEPHLRDIGQHMLESLGFSTELAEHGVAALERIDHRQKCDYSAIILDLTMPVMDGSETLASIRQRSSTVPVIIASGFGKDDIDQRLIKHHVNGFLQKPFSLADLTQCLRQVTQTEV
ncbi:MAG: PAS domain-containing sensor histidine kinase [Planctomycetota bacterium]|nr:MAG: PAS domain-containing sensor histidine kinase [Planctomycetota bacterium]